VKRIPWTKTKFREC